MSKRFLIVIYDKFLLQLILVEAASKGVRVSNYQKIRVFPFIYDFSITEFILQSIELWGKELGIVFTKERVPIVPQVGKEGLAEIFIFSHKKEDSLFTITKNVFILANNEISQKGALTVTKFLDFENLLHISFDDNRTDVIRYLKGNKGRIKVVSESKEFNLDNILKDSDFINYLDKFKTHFSKDFNVFDFLGNTARIPLFNMEIFEEAVCEYLTEIIRLRFFRQCRKLEIEKFTKSGITGNILVISGDRLRLINNIPMALLSVVSALDLKGMFRVFIDKYGLFDLLHRRGKTFLKEESFEQLLLEDWGRVISISGSKRVKLDQVVADVDIQDGNSKKEIIPMYGRILAFEFADKGSINIQMKDGFNLIPKKMGRQLKLEDIKGNLVINSNDCSFENILKDEKDAEVVKRWLSGIGAVSDGRLNS